MVKSMTGFGRGSFTEESLTVTVEIKSVNHRYFEYSGRIPRSCSFLDEKLKSFLNKTISRGKTEVFVAIEESGNGSVAVEINNDYAKAYFDALKRLSAEYGIEFDVKASDLVGNQDLFDVKQQTASEEQIEKAVMAATGQALENFIQMRLTEGERLAEDVKKRTEYILELVSFIEKRSPETVAEYRRKLEQKIKELLGDKSVDEQRLLTETAIFADKIAVAEETVRLRSHINQLTSLLESNEPSGRKLDFIVQEMNRESNTIGSKAQDIDIAHTVVDIKAEIEKIREQIQNIE